VVRSHALRSPPRPAAQPPVPDRPSGGKNQARRNRQPRARIARRRHLSPALRRRSKHAAPHGASRRDANQPDSASDHPHKHPADSVSKANNNRHSQAAVRTRDRASPLRQTPPLSTETQTRRSGASDSTVRSAPQQHAASVSEFQERTARSPDAASASRHNSILCAATEKLSEFAPRPTPAPRFQIAPSSRRRTALKTAILKIIRHKITRPEIARRKIARPLDTAPTLQKGRPRRIKTTSQRKAIPEIPPRLFPALRTRLRLRSPNQTEIRSPVASHRITATRRTPTCSRRRKIPQRSTRRRQPQTRRPLEIAQALRTRRIRPRQKQIHQARRTPRRMEATLRSGET